MKASLRESQKLMTTILRDFDKVCKKNDIKYWIESGTLLGAIRHGGFIPWDDDIDVGMLREDYNRFLEIAKNDLPNDLVVNNFRNEKEARYQWSKIKHKYSRIVEDENNSLNEGLFIDIFPYDIYSNDNKCELKLLKKKYKKQFSILYYKELDKFQSNSDRLKSYFSKFLCSIIFKKTFSDICNDISLNLKSINSIKNGVISYGVEVVGYDNYLEISDIFPLKDINFEDINVKCPNNIDKYLRNLYGEDYMKIPEEKDRFSHNNGIFIERERA
ncbi:LicD family protein [Clostridium perfringens]|uniref:LicD family protein n=1 Tax=Clostridium perfringens TaxID=1502 RepID=UPI002A253609|nr:LicD family protein [Clostridium perfringens]MDK0780051.1 LicD family protein [Clostridium perfringens]